MNHLRKFNERMTDDDLEKSINDKSLRENSWCYG